MAWIAALILAALAAFGFVEWEPQAKGDALDGSGATATQDPPAAPRDADELDAKPRPDATDPTGPEVDPERPTQLTVEGPRGPTDLVPTLRRIERGERHEHRNDGSVFQNRERRLPDQPRGYYREYVHPTPGVRGPGAQRLVIGRDGDVWYTPDHYESFERIRWRLEMGNGR